MTNQSEQAKGLEYQLKQIFKKANYDLNYPFAEYHFIDLMKQAYQLGQQSQPCIKQWVSEWIDVNDRLPEANQLVFLYSGGVFLQAYRFFPKGHVGMPEDLFYDLNNKGPLTVKEISHWMPIPLHANSTTTPKSDMVSMDKVIEIIHQLAEKYKQDQTHLSERVIQEYITKIKGL